MGRPPRTFAEVVVAKLGIWKAGQAMKVIGVTTAWAVCLVLDGDDQRPTQVRVAEVYCKSQPSVNRDLAAFRKAFPEEEDPHRIALVLAADISRSQAQALDRLDGLVMRASMTPMAKLA